MKKKDKKVTNNKSGEEKAEIKEIFDSALNEDITELSELSDVDDTEIAPEKAPVSEKRRKTLYFLLGLFILIMAGVGVVSTVRYTADRIENIVENTEQKNEFAKFIYPIVICDPAPFDKTVKLRNETIISAAAWDIILYEDKSRYEQEFDYMIVPEVDIEQHAAKLFGTGLSITHCTISSTEVPFYYDISVNSYRIPSNPKYFTYSPSIESIEKNGDSYTLTVGYVSPTPAWLALESEDTPSPEKYVEYTVREDHSGYTLTAIQPSDKQADSAFENGL